MYCQVDKKLAFEHAAVLDYVLTSADENCHEKAIDTGIVRLHNATNR